MGRHVAPAEKGSRESDRQSEEMGVKDVSKLDTLRRTRSRAVWGSMCDQRGRKRIDYGNQTQIFA